MVARDRGDGPHAGARDRRRAWRRRASATSSTEIAAALPLQIICDMMGIPRERQRAHLRADEHHPRRRRPEYVHDDGRARWRAGMELFQYAQALGRGPRSANPRDDITTRADARRGRRRDGSPLRQEFGSFFLLLVVGRQRDDAQRDQPRHVGAHRPSRPAPRLDGRLRRRARPTAVEEIVRWATPVIHFRRTATARHRGRRAGRSRPATRS